MANSLCQPARINPYVSIEAKSREQPINEEYIKERIQQIQDESKTAFEGKAFEIEREEHFPVDLNSVGLQIHVEQINYEKLEEYIDK